jgi:hypothetical protein
MIDWVKESRRTPEQAVTYMARFCSCGVFNPARACRILEECRKGSHPQEFVKARVFHWVSLIGRLALIMARRPPK